MDGSGQNIAPRLLTMAEVANAIGCSLRTVERAIERRQLVATRIGRAVRVSVDDLRTYLDSHRDT